MIKTADKKKIVLFDFDGVIADSFDAAMVANKILTPEITDDEYKALFDGNINDYKKFLSKEEKEKVDRNFFDTYIPLMLDTVGFFPGMKEAIKKLEEKYILIIISSTITSPIKEFVGKNEMAEHFDGVMGNDVHRSKVEKIKMVFEKYGAKPEDCVFVTDTLGDIKEAEKTGVKSIAVAWGFQSRENLLKGEPHCVVETPEDLCGAISDYFEE